MLMVTRPALKRLLRRLARKEAGADMALRFTRRKGGWRLRLDRASPDDTAFTHEGRNVLLLDETVSKAMANMKLVVTETEAGPRLRLRRTRDLEE